MWKTRFELLTETGKENMEAFSERTILESKERTPVYWGPEEAKRRLAEVLFGDLLYATEFKK